MLNIGKRTRIKVADRIPEDRKTVKLVLKIQLRRAHGPVENLTLESHTREGL